jgi:hypothetical protein
MNINKNLSLKQTLLKKSEALNWASGINWWLSYIYAKKIKVTYLTLNSFNNSKSFPSSHRQYSK